jgi:hypothetical protein
MTESHTRPRRAARASAVGLAVLLASAGAAEARAATPPPDAAAMTLTRDDLPAGAHALHRGPVPPSRAEGILRGYQGSFAYTGPARRRSGLLAVEDIVQPTRSPAVAFGAYEVVRIELAHSRRQLARAFARSAHVPVGTVRVGRPRNEHLGDGAFAVPITAVVHHRRSTSTIALLSFDRVVAQLDVVGAPGGRHVMSRTHRLLADLRDHIRTALLPQPTSAPTISGTPQAGSVLQATAGTWDPATAPATTSYAWQRCDATGAACSPIPGATQSSYAPTAADRGATLRVAVTGRNEVGSATAVSDPTAPVA